MFKVENRKRQIIMETLKKQNNKPEKGNGTPEIQKLYMLISGARKKL